MNTFKGKLYTLLIIDKIFSICTAVEIKRHRSRKLGGTFVSFVQLQLDFQNAEMQLHYLKESFAS